jgi:phosphohistidine phosphatase SixA
MPFMEKEYARLRRKTFFVPVIAALLGGLLLLAAGYRWHEWTLARAPATLVVVMRHAEKELDQGSDPALSPEGLLRSQRLASMASDTGQLGFDHIYVTELHRTQATVAMLYLAHGGVVTTLPSTDPSAVARSIRAEDRGRRVLVVAHSDTVGQIVHALAPEVSVPDMADNEYGTTYVMAVPKTGRAVVLKVRLP